MTAPYEGSASEFIRALATKPEALLLAGCLAAMVALAWLGLPGWLATGGPVSIYVLYMIRCELADRHETRRLETQIRIEEQKQLAKVEGAVRKRDTRKQVKGVTSPLKRTG